MTERRKKWEEDLTKLKEALESKDDCEKIIVIRKLDEGKFVRVVIKTFNHSPVEAFLEANRIMMEWVGPCPDPTPLEAVAIWLAVSAIASGYAISLPASLPFLKELLKKSAQIKGSLDKDKIAALWKECQALTSTESRISLTVRIARALGVNMFGIDKIWAWLNGRKMAIGLLLVFLPEVAEHVPAILTAFGASTGIVAGFTKGIGWVITSIGAIHKILKGQ